MWPSNSNWPKWPQNMPNTVEETNHWAELARQWAAANTPPQPPPAQQLPPPPPPPPPPPVEPIKLEDQDDRILVPLVPFDDNSSSMHYNNYDHMPSRDYLRPPDKWQDDNHGYYPPSVEAYGSYPDVYERPHRPPFRPVAPPLQQPPPHAMHNPVACPRPFNGEDDWVYRQQHCYPSKPPTMPYPPPPGPSLPPLPPPVLFPVGNPDVHPPPLRHRLPPPQIHQHPIPEQIIPAFHETVNSWLPPQQSAPQPRSALPAWLRDELERLEKQKRKEQQKLELAQEAAKDRVRESFDERDLGIRHNTDDAVLMEAESEASDNSDDNEAEEDTGSDLGKVRATNNYSPSHGGSISSLKTAPGMESPPPPVTELDYQAACARLQGSPLTNECHRFIRDALTDLLLEVTTLAINEVCEETLLQARQTAYGVNSDPVSNGNDNEDEAKSSTSSSPLPAGAGVLGLTAYVSDSESEIGDHPDPKPSKPEELPLSTSADKPVAAQEPKGAQKDIDSEAPEAPPPPPPGSPSLKSQLADDKKSKKEIIAKNTKPHGDEKKRLPSTVSKSKERPSRSNERDKAPSKSKKSKIDRKDTASSSSHHQRRRSRSHRRSRSRDLSTRRSRRRSRSRSGRRSRRYSRRCHHRSRSSKSTSTSSSSMSSSRSRGRHRYRRRH